MGRGGDKTRECSPPTEGRSFAAREVGAAAGGWGSGAGGGLRLILRDNIRQTRRDAKTYQRYQRCWCKISQLV